MNMVRLSDIQLYKKLEYIKNYIKPSKNAADGSTFDANANVSLKNIATLEAEINKDINIQINRALVKNKIDTLYGKEVGDEYIRQIEDHEIYVHDESSLKPYCVSISMYPFLMDGLTKLGGESGPPKNLNSFCGSFINLIFAISSQFAGAVASVEFLLYFDYFARKEYGDNYLETHTHEINNCLQQVVYSINQPAAARGYQSVFWNISIYDEPYFDSMFGDFVFPDDDLTPASWNGVKNLQAHFMDWFNAEREKNILTFPVITAAMLVDDVGPVDGGFAEMCASEMENGNSFFVYQSTSADSLASCCRLRNEFLENTFSYTLGAGGVATGSINVITINMNRLVQDGRDLKAEIQKIHKYQVAYAELMNEYKEAGMLTVYDANFISLKKQFLTIGINGLVEAAESQGIEATNSQEYKDFCSNLLKIIYDENKLAKQTYSYMFNTEFVPAENLGPKNYEWDKYDGYIVPSDRNCYNSYFYVVENDDTNVIDKFMLHGKEINQYLDGGSALHLNLDDYLTKENYLNLYKISAKTGCNYFCTNTKITICNDCGAIDKTTQHICKECKSTNVDWATRIIGYLKRVGAWSTPRQVEHAKRHYHTK